MPGLHRAERGCGPLAAGKAIEALGDDQQIGPVFGGQRIGCNLAQLIGGFAVVAGAQLGEHTLRHVAAFRLLTSRQHNNLMKARFQNGCVKKGIGGAAVEPPVQSAACLVCSRPLIRAASLSNSRAMPRICPRVSENRSCSAMVRSSSALYLVEFAFCPRSSRQISDLFPRAVNVRARSGLHAAGRRSHRAD